MIDLPTTAPLEPADDRKVAAALIEHGVLTRDDLAAAVPSHWIWAGLTSIGMPPRGGRRVPAVWVAATRPLGADLSPGTPCSDRALSQLANPSTPR